MELFEAVVWAAAGVLPACIVIAPLLLAVFERSLSEPEQEGAAKNEAGKPGTGTQEDS